MRGKKKVSYSRASSPVVFSKAALFSFTKILRVVCVFESVLAMSSFICITLKIIHKAIVYLSCAYLNKLMTRTALTLPSIHFDQLTLSYI